MDVIIKLHAELRLVFKNKEMQISFERNTATLSDVIDKLLSIEPVGEHAERIIVSSPKARPSTSSGDCVNPALIILINDADYRLVGGIDAPLHDGDSITLLPTIHGG
jgi:molybdopterin converting factor small subunit